MRGYRENLAKFSAGVAVENVVEMIDRMDNLLLRFKKHKVSRENLDRKELEQHATLKAIIAIVKQL